MIGQCEICDNYGHLFWIDDDYWGCYDCLIDEVEAEKDPFGYDADYVPDYGEMIRNFQEAFLREVDNVKPGSTIWRGANLTLGLIQEVFGELLEDGNHR